MTIHDRAGFLPFFACLWQKCDDSSLLSHLLSRRILQVPWLLLMLWLKGFVVVLGCSSSRTWCLFPLIVSMNDGRDTTKKNWTTREWKKDVIVDPKKRSFSISLLNLLLDSLLERNSREDFDLSVCFLSSFGLSSRSCHHRRHLQNWSLFLSLCEWMNRDKYWVETLMECNIRKQGTAFVETGITRGRYHASHDNDAKQHLKISRWLCDRYVVVASSPYIPVWTGNQSWEKRKKPTVILSHKSNHERESKR